MVNRMYSNIIVLRLHFFLVAPQISTPFIALILILFILFLEHFADRLSDEVYPQEKVIAEIVYPGDETRLVQFKMSDVPESNKLEKFVEDVRCVLCLTLLSIVYSEIIYNRIH